MGNKQNNASKSPTRIQKEAEKTLNDLPKNLGGAGRESSGGGGPTTSKDFRERLSVRKNVKEFHGEYKKIKELGAGITGTVFQVENKKGQEKAMKTINFSRFNKSQIKELRMEVQLLKNLDHPNIVRLIEVYENPNSVMLVMDLCKGGNLASPSARGRLKTELQVSSVIYQLLLAVKYVHERTPPIVHRDIKLENVMFVSEDPTSLHVQLIDFGLSGIQRQSPFWRINKNKRLFATTCGTTFYMAPEVIEGGYGKECDLWSLGVLAYVLLSGRPPFIGDDEKTTIKRIRQSPLEFSSPIWQKLSPSAMDLMRGLLTKDPMKRLTSDQALSSKWFETYKTEIKSVGEGAELEQDVVSSLSKFVNYGKMKKMAMLVIAHHTAGKELGELRAAFTALDKDNSGSITFNELKILLLKNGLSEEEATKLFLNVDVDDSGELQLTEFLAATMEAICIIDREKMGEAFDHIARGNDYITIHHLHDLLGKTIQKAQLNQMIKDLDQNNDGKISKEEFLALVEVKQVEEVENAMGELSIREDDSY